MTTSTHPVMALSAIIPAAGLSSRMHTYKPLLKLGGRPMIEVVIHLFQSCGISDIIVVTGHNKDRLEDIIRNTGARPVFNTDFKTGMLGSIQKGVRQVSSESWGFFLLPVDIAAVRPATIQTLIAAFNKHENSVLIPEFNGVTGHPPVISTRLVPSILSMDSDSNLGELLLSSKKNLVRWKVHDRGILMDADTKEDYEILSQKYQKLSIPDKTECYSIIQRFLPGETDIQSHLECVAETAMKLGAAVKKTQMDLDLIQAASLLHDIKRREKHHARAGSVLVESLGFPEVADIIAEHMTIQFKK